MRPLISSGGRLKAFNNPDAVRTIFAFDARVIWPGSTATRMLVPVVV